MACRQKFNLRVDVIYGVHHEIGGPERVTQHLRLHLRPVHYVERLDRRLGEILAKYFSRHADFGVPTSSLVARQCLLRDERVI